MCKYLSVLIIHFPEYNSPFTNHLCKNITTNIGGIIDNAAYEDAKNEQAFIEGRIRTLENMLNTAILISKPSDDTARVGSTVTVHQINGTEKNYVIVGSPESDPSVGKISNVSPIGKALIGKRVGDKTTISAPAGEIELEITKIK